LPPEGHGLAFDATPVFGLRSAHLLDDQAVPTLGPLYSGLRSGSWQVVAGSA